MTENFVSERQLEGRQEAFDSDNPLDGLTIDQVDNWIDTNVTDLASARTALKKTARILKRHEVRIRRIERLLRLR